VTSLAVTFVASQLAEAGNDDGSGSDVTPSIFIFPWPDASGIRGVALLNGCQSKERQNHLRVVSAECENSGFVPPKHIANEIGIAIAYAQPEDFRRCSAKHAQVDQVCILREQRELVLS